MSDLLYTLRPAGDDIDFGDQSDATYAESQFNLPTTRRLSFEALVADTVIDRDALISHVIVRSRARITTPPLQTRYTDAEVTLGFETGESLALDVAMWDQNFFSERSSAPITESPRGNDWTLAELLESYIGAACTVQGGSSPSPAFAASDFALDVYGVPSAELPLRKFDPGVYDLGLDGTRYIAHLTDVETKSVYDAAKASGVPLSLKALSLDSGALIDRETTIVNSDAQGMLDAIAAAGGGSQTPPEV